MKRQIIKRTKSFTMVKSHSKIFKPNFSNELNIESIISAPLVAASKANVVMVTGQTRFLLDYCFTKKEKFRKDLDHNHEKDDVPGKEKNHRKKVTYEPVMIEMSMTRSVIDHDKSTNDPGYIQNVKMKFNVPLLSLIPINSLVIDKVKVDFNMEITSVTYYTPISKISNKQPHLLEKQAQLNGRISYDPDQNTGNQDQNRSQMASRLKVSIHAGPLPLPVGVLTILDMYNRAIQPNSPEKK